MGNICSTAGDDKKAVEKSKTKPKINPGKKTESKELDKPIAAVFSEKGSGPGKEKSVKVDSTTLKDLVVRAHIGQIDDEGKCTPKFWFDGGNILMPVDDILPEDHDDWGNLHKDYLCRGRNMRAILQKVFKEEPSPTLDELTEYVPSLEEELERKYKIDMNRVTDVRSVTRLHVGSKGPETCIKDTDARGFGMSDVGQSVGSVQVGLHKNGMAIRVHVVIKNVIFGAILLLNSPIKETLAALEASANNVVEVGDGPFTGIVFLRNAEGLRNADSGDKGESDPYTVVKVKGGGSWKSKTVVDCLEPVWEEEVIFKGLKLNDVIQFEVFDNDGQRDAHDSLGTYEYTVDKAEWQDKLVELNDPSAAGDTSPKLNLLIKIEAAAKTQASEDKDQMPSLLTLAESDFFTKDSEKAAPGLLSAMEMEFLESDKEDIENKADEDKKEAEVKIQAKPEVEEEVKQEVKEEVKQEVEEEVTKAVDAKEISESIQTIESMRGGDRYAEISIHEARGLRDADSSQITGDGKGKSDPFVKVSVKGGESKYQWRTRTVQDSLNPKWEEKVFFSHLNLGDQISIDVFDDDYGGSNDLLGSTQVIVRPGSVDRDWVSLIGAKCPNSELSISVKFGSMNEKREAPASPKAAEPKEPARNFEVQAEEVKSPIRKFEVEVEEPSAEERSVEEPKEPERTFAVKVDEEPLGRNFDVTVKDAKNDDADRDFVIVEAKASRGSGSQSQDGSLESGEEPGKKVKGRKSVNWDKKIEFDDKTSDTLPQGSYLPKQNEAL